MAITERSRCTAAVTIWQCWSRQLNAVNTSKNRTWAVQALQMSARCWWAHRETCRRRSDLEKKQKASALVLQAWYRAVQTRNEYAKRYRTILFLARRQSLRQQHSGALAIQSGQENTKPYVFVSKSSVPSCTYDSPLDDPWPTISTRMLSRVL